MGLMQFLKEKKLDFCILLILAGGAILFMTFMTVLADEGGTGLWNDISAKLGTWNYWLLLFGGAIFILGAFYFLDYIRKGRELNKLLEINSKSKFIQNQDRIEELAWRLGRDHEKRVVDRKKELRVK